MSWPISKEKGQNARRKPQFAVIDKIEVLYNTQRHNYIYVIHFVYEPEENEIEQRNYTPLSSNDTHERYVV